MAEYGLRPISSHLDRTSLVNKGLLYGIKKTIFLRVIPSGQDSPISPAWVANKSAGFGSS